MIQAKVISSVVFSEKEVLLNDESYFQFSANEIDEKLKELYDYLSLDYPKFYKMDLLGKAAILASELLIPLVKNPPMVFLSNEKSSMQSDLNHIEQYHNYETASAATFVYTLPNICVGEICIKNQWHVPTGFIVLPKNQIASLVQMGKSYHQQYKNKNALLGFVEATQQELCVSMVLTSFETDSEKENAETYFKRTLSH